MSIELEPHNQESYKKVKEFLKTYNRAAILDTSGLGKTYTSMKLIEDNPDSKFLYVNIYSVMLHKLKRDLIDNGVKCSKENLERKTYMGLISLMKQGKLDELTGFDYIILDEFQICGAPETQKAIQMLLDLNPDAKILGLSATPIRFFDDDNARDMAEELFGDLIASEITEEEAQERGLKKSPIYTVGLYEYEKIVDGLEFQIKNCSDEERRKMAEAELKILREYLDAEVKGLPELLETAMTNKSGKYIVYCKNIADMEEKMKEAEKIFEKVNPNMTIRCVASNRGDLSNERSIRDFDQDNGEETLKLLFSVDMINLAYHPNEIDGVVMMRPTNSPNLYYCQYGRATSVNSDKQPVIVDLVDNIDTIEIIEDYFRDQLRNGKADKTADDDKADDDKDKKETINSRKINISGKILEIQEIIGKINDLLRRKNYLTDKEKYEIMMEFMKQAEGKGEKLKADTVYNGYHIGSWRNNLRAGYWENGLPNMDPKLVQAFKDAGIITEEKEKEIKRTTDEEKMEFLMSLVGKTKEERNQAIMELENGSSTYRSIIVWLQRKYDNGDLSDEQVITLRKNEILGVTIKEKKEIADKYKIPTKYIKNILKEYGTFEEFLYKYKRGECDYEFKYDTFVGPRAVAISSKEITEKQKQGYYDLLINVSPSLKKSSGKQKLYRMDIDEIEQMLLIVEAKERDVKWVRLYYGLDGERSTFLKIAKEYGVSSNLVQVSVAKVILKLKNPHIYSESCLVDISNENIEESLYPKQLEYYLNEENIFDPNTIIPSVERKLKFDSKEDLKEKKQNEINGDSTLEGFDFSSRVWNCLARAGIRTAKDLYDWIEKDGKVNFDKIKTIRYFGNKLLDEVIDKLITVGFLKKNEDGELELQPDRLYPEKHSLSEVVDAVSDLNESQVYGTLREINDTVQRKNPGKEPDEKNISDS